jgi:hypothetical protein
LAKGRIELLISNNRSSAQSYLDTLYSGCSFGSYGAIKAAEYTLSAKALTE